MKSLLQTTLSLLWLIVFMSSANSETYKWVDDKGVMSFSDNLSIVPPKYRTQINNSTYTDEPRAELSLLRTREIISSGPVIKETYDYYEIQGRTEKELQQQMDASGIEGGYYAYTRWYVKWNYTYTSTPESCAIATVATRVDVNYQLPKWVSHDDSPADLKNKWSRFIQKLELHEYGHKDIGVQAAGEIERSIAALKPRPSCEELGLTANSIGLQLLERSKPIEVDYDVRTRHGRTQGANFP